MDEQRPPRRRGRPPKRPEDRKPRRSGKSGRAHGVQGDALQAQRRALRNAILAGIGDDSPREVRALRELLAGDEALDLPLPLGTPGRIVGVLGMVQAGASARILDYWAGRLVYRPTVRIF